MKLDGGTSGLDPTTRLHAADFRQFLADSWAKLAPPSARWLCGNRWPRSRLCVVLFCAWVVSARLFFSNL